MKSKDKDGGSNSLKDAKSNKDKGDSEIKSSCLSCRFKPNCHDAIPYYKLAANQYHNLKEYKEEIYCREKLAFCFRTLTSEWEEGKEHEQISLIFLNQLSDPETAYKSIHNAHQAFFIKADYQKSITCLNNLSEAYLALNMPDYAQKCLKLAFDDCLTVYHTLVIKQDENYEFIYKCFDSYVTFLFKSDNLKEVIPICDNILKVILPYESIKTKIMRYYAYKMLAAIILEDRMEYETLKGEADKAVNQHGAGDIIDAVEDINRYINQSKEAEFKRSLKLLQEYFDIEIVKKIKILYDKVSKQNKAFLAPEDIKIVTNPYENNIEIIEQDSNDFT